MRLSTGRPIFSPFSYLKEISSVCLCFMDLEVRSIILEVFLTFLVHMFTGIIWAFTSFRWTHMKKSIVPCYCDYNVYILSINRIAKLSFEAYFSLDRADFFHRLCKKFKKIQSMLLLSREGALSCHISDGDLQQSPRSTEDLF
jgi:hypothetical protein